MKTLKRPKKAVSFATIEATDIESPLSHSVPPPSRSDLQSRWYSKDELSIMKSSAVQLWASRRKAFGPHVATPRGMESYTKQRTDHRNNAVRYVLLAHKVGKGEDFIAELSQKLSSWNAELAFTDACRDYFDVYRPALVHFVPLVLSGPPKITLVPKRGASPTNACPTLDHQSRRVRRKLA